MEGLEISDPGKYRSLAPSSLKRLEAGRRRPRMATAVTLAAVLEQDIDTLFPSGVDDPVRNPEGKTRIAPDRKIGGRPRKE